MGIDDGLARRWANAMVVVQRLVAPSGHGLRDHDPRVGVAEDAGIFLIAGRVRRDFTQFEAIAGVSRLVQHDTVLGSQPLANRLQHLRRLAVLQPDAGHNAHALRLDEDLALLALMRADLITEGVVSAQEPLAIPAMLQDRGFHTHSRVDIVQR